MPKAFFEVSVKANLPFRSREYNGSVCKSILEKGDGLCAGVRISLRRETERGIGSSEGSLEAGSSGITTMAYSNGFWCNDKCLCDLSYSCEEGRKAYNKIFSYYKNWG